MWATHIFADANVVHAAKSICNKCSSSSQSDVPVARYSLKSTVINIGLSGIGHPFTSLVCSFSNAVQVLYNLYFCGSSFRYSFSSEVLHNLVLIYSSFVLFGLKSEDLDIKVRFLRPCIVHIFSTL